MRLKLVTPIVAAALALALGACGGYDSGTSSDAPADGEAAAAAAGSSADSSADAALVRTGTTALGEVLTTAEGLTLYGLTDDAEGVPTCDGECAEAWPPLLVDGDQLPAGLDPAVFGVAQRLDGTHQLTAGGSPLYTFAGDAAAGDVNGQGTGGVWFAAKPDGQLTIGVAAAGQAPETEETQEAQEDPAATSTTSTPPSTDEGQDEGDGYGYSGGY